MGWIGERLEWAVDNLFNKDSEGVLVLRINPENDVTLSLDEVREAPHLTTSDLLVENDVIVGVQYDGEPVAGTVWLERDGVLCASCDELVSATGTLVRDLAATLGLPVEVLPQRQADATGANDETDASDANDTNDTNDTRGSSAFLISDEFGFVPIWGDVAAGIAETAEITETAEAAAAPPTATEWIKDCFAKLW
jgi:hypothetical protein